MSKMTSRERLLAASRRHPVDTIPISPRLGEAVLAHFGSYSHPNILRLKEIYDYDPVLTLPGNMLPFKNPYEVFDYAPGVHVDIHAFDEGSKRIVDRIVHTPDGDMHEKILVPNPGQSEYGRGPNPVRVENLVKEPGDLPKLKHLIPPLSGKFIKEYHAWESVVGEEAVTRITIYGPIDFQAGEAISIEDLMVSYLLDRAFALEVVDLFWQQIMAQTKYLLEEGARYFFTPWFWHSISAGWSPDMFRDWFFPMIQKQVDLIHQYEGIVNYYDDGNCMEILPMLVEAGVDVVETCTPPPVGDFDLVEAKELYGAQLTFSGYIDLIYVLQRGTVEEVIDKVREACTIGGEGGGFILGTSDSMRENTPMENINAYFKTGREYGNVKDIESMGI